MIGKILEFDREKSTGFIGTQSGNKYKFHISDYKEEETYPKKGISVEFMLEEEVAIFIYPIKETKSATTKNQNITTSMYSKVSLIAGIIGVLAFVYFAYNHAYVEKGYFYTIPSLFAILTGHISRKSKIASLGLSLGYIVTMMYIVVIAVGSVLS